MQWESFEKLEQKIKQVLEQVDKFKEENEQVTNSYNNLSSKFFEIEEKKKSLVKENIQLKAQIKEREESIKSKEEKVKRKIDSLLTRIEGIK
jgi:FtsZ-binding cell division protein ZapB